MQRLERLRLGWVDSARGIAVLFVFGLHLVLDLQRRAAHDGFALPGWFSVAEVMVFGPLDLGKIGVAIFFLVSGFLIPITLDKPGLHVIRDFSLNRFFRLYPAYWVSILVYLAAMPLVLSTTQVLVNFTMLQRFLGTPDLNGVFWTLQIELVFYMLCVLLKRIGRLGDVTLMKRFVIGLGIAAVLLAGVRYGTGLKLPVALLLALQLMFFGYLYRMWFVAETLARSDILRMGVPVLLTLALACPLAYSRDYGLGENWARYVASYVFSLAAFVFISLKAWQPRWLSFIGRISYSFYLLHTIAISVCIELIVAAPIGIDALRFAVLVAASLLLSLTLSWASFRWIEQPGIAMGRRMLLRRRALAVPELRN